MSYKTPRVLEAIFPKSNSAKLFANIEFLEKLPRPTDTTVLRPVT
jgi:hypothetical protein